MMSSIFMYNWPFLHPFHKISTQTICLFGCLRVLFKKGIFISSWFIPCNPSCIGWTPCVYLNNFCCLHLSIVDVFSCSLVSNYFVASWTVARQAPLSVEFSRQEYWSGVPFPPPGDLPDPGIEPAYPALTGRIFTPEPPGNLNHWIVISSLLNIFGLSPQCIYLQSPCEFLGLFPFSHFLTPPYQCLIISLLLYYTFSQRAP